MILLWYRKKKSRIKKPLLFAAGSQGPTTGLLTLFSSQQMVGDA